jgi:hypothetical protein
MEYERGPLLGQEAVQRATQVEVTVDWGRIGSDFLDGTQPTAENPSPSTFRSDRFADDDAVQPRLEPTRLSNR